MRIHINKNFYLDFIRMVGLWLIILGFVFEFPVIGPITSRRLSIIIAMTILGISKKTFVVVRKCRLKYVIGPILGLLLCMFISSLNNMGQVKVGSNEYFKPWYIIYCICYIVIMSVFVIVAFKDFYEFCTVYLSIMLFQSFVVYIAAVSKDFRLFIYNHFYYGDDRFEQTILNGSRIIGINLQGALGSIILFSGTIILFYLITRKKISDIMFSLCFFVIFGATFFIGRTGLYLEILFLGYYIFLTSNSKKKIINLLVITILTVFVIQFLLVKVNSDVAEFFLRWAGELFFSDTRRRTFDALRNMSIPPLSHETILGTNIMRGISTSGIVISNDSGYIQLYSALGIVGSLIYYLSFMVLYLIPIIRCRDKKLRNFMFLLLCVMFVIEYKEPFIQKYIYSFVAYTIFLNESFETTIPNRERKQLFCLRLL